MAEQTPAITQAIAGLDGVASCLRDARLADPPEAPPVQLANYSHVIRGLRNALEALEVR